MPNLPSHQSVYLMYGIGEGPGLERSLKKALAKSNLYLAKSYQAADIILCHSGGVTELPASITGKILIMVAPSFGTQGQGIGALNSGKFKLDFAALRRRHQLTLWAVKTGLNIFYLLLQIPRGIAMYRAVKASSELLPSFDTRPVIIIRYAEDPWSQLLTSEVQAKYPHYIFLDLPGSHDDLWTNPRHTVSAVLETLML